MSKRRTAGMTLIELMIVMVIIGILSAIAYPTYQSHTAKTRRKAAVACLSQYANFMERYYTSNLNYDGAERPGLGCFTESDLDRYYTFSQPNVDADFRTYTISADPNDAQDQKDPDHCGTLTLNQASARTPARNACW
jgi:type IV pilus assembly protein PilE